MPLLFVALEMKAQREVLALLLAVVFYCGLANQTPSQVDNELSKEYVLTGSVMDDESAIIALQRESVLTYQLNLPKYLGEVPKPSAGKENDFNDQDFAIVGSLATVDASIVFGEGIKNLQVIAAETELPVFLVAQTQ